MNADSIKTENETVLVNQERYRKLDCIEYRKLYAVIL